MSLSEAFGFCFPRNQRNLSDQINISYIQLLKATQVDDLFPSFQCARYGSQLSLSASPIDHNQDQHHHHWLTFQHLWKPASVRLTICRSRPGLCRTPRSSHFCWKIRQSREDSLSDKRFMCCSRRFQVLETLNCCSYLVLWPSVSYQAIVKVRVNTVFLPMKRVLR